MHALSRPGTGPASLRFVADDLSGAAECAAALAVARREPVPLVLAGAQPRAGSYAVDSDTRALASPAAAERAAAAVLEALATAPAPTLLFKKIDSTLRGHVGAELKTILAASPRFDAAIVCPALPDQGRTLSGGVLHVHGEVQRNDGGQPLHLCDLLKASGVPALWIDTAAAQDPGQLADLLAGAIASGAGLLVVDARDRADLQRVARALLMLLSYHRVLAVGAAGLAKALAWEIQGHECASAVAPLRLPRLSAGPVVAVVGSFSPVSAAQVQEIANDGRIAVVRLPAEVWLDPAAARTVTAAVDRARAAASDGHAVVLTAVGGPVTVSTRELVQVMARAADDVIRQASTLVLTGGDTARTVLDHLGIRRLEVIGEVEPGICASRGARLRTPCVVTKAGGFGDRGTLLRVMRQFEALRAASTIIGENA